MSEESIPPTGENPPSIQRDVDEERATRAIDLLCIATGMNDMAAKVVRDLATRLGKACREEVRWGAFNQACTQADPTKTVTHEGHTYLLQREIAYMSGVLIGQGNFRMTHLPNADPNVPPT